MYLHRIRLSRSPRSAEETEPFSSPYRLHIFLWKLFAKEDQSRDFLYRLDLIHSSPVLYVLSARQPQLPNSDFPFEIETKAYRPVLEQGQSFAFSLRANPTITKTPQGEKQRRHDVVMDAKLRERQQNGTPRTLAEIVQDSCERWIEKKSEKSGFSSVSVRADGYQQIQFRKRGQEIRISTVELQGVLRVIDVSAFQQTLFSGIGSARAWGCGLLLLKRIPEI